MQKDDEVGKVAQATPVVICTFFLYPTYDQINLTYSNTDTYSGVAKQKP